MNATDLSPALSSNKETAHPGFMPVTLSLAWERKGLERFDTTVRSGLGDKVLCLCKPYHTVSGE